MSKNKTEQSEAQLKSTPRHLAESLVFVLFCFLSSLLNICKEDFLEAAWETSPNISLSQTPTITKTLWGLLLVGEEVV